MDTRPPNIIQAVEAILGTKGGISERTPMFQYFSHAIGTFEEFRYETSPLSMALKTESAGSAYARLLKEVPDSRNKDAIAALDKFQAYYAETIREYDLMPKAEPKAKFDLVEKDGKPVLVCRP